MQQKEILLIKHVEKLGSEGDVVKVRPGYARNYLIPRKKALPLNYANKKRLDSLKLARVARETEELQDAQSMASKLGETSIAVAVKTGTGGKLFGSVTATQIVEKFQEKGFKLEKKHLVKFSPIKVLGLTKVLIRFHKEIEVEVSVEVVSENPIEEIN